MTAGQPDGQRRDPFAASQDRALDALTLAWGDTYEIYINDGQWQAWHDDAPDQDKLTGTTRLGPPAAIEIAQTLNKGIPMQRASDSGSWRPNIIISRG